MGDVFQAGAVRVQVSQPRQPCATLSRFWRCPDLLPVLWETARSGWYFRVLAEGEVRPGDRLERLERPHPGWTVARLLRLLRDREKEGCREASRLAYLSLGWRRRFEALAGPG